MTFFTWYRIIDIIFLIGVLIFLTYQICEYLHFRQWQQQRRKRDKMFMQNVIAPIADNYEAPSTGKAHLSMSFYVPIPAHETGLKETLNTLFPLFPDAIIEPYRTVMEVGKEPVPCVRIMVDPNKPLTREQHIYLKQLPMRYTVINNS